MCVLEVAPSGVRRDFLGSLPGPALATRPGPHVTASKRVARKVWEILRKLLAIEMSYSLPSRNVRFWPSVERGDGKVLAVEGRVAPTLHAQGRGDGAGSEASG